MTFEQPMSPEQEREFSSKIALRFFRHDEKGVDPSKKDEEIELTAAGRLHAKAQAEETNLAQAVAFGSPRLRAQETAGFVMAGASEEITGEESFDELKAKVDKGLGYGSKIGIDPRLNFELGADNDYARAAVEAFKKGELMRFLVDQSDQLAAQVGDEVSSTYLRMAAQIASIIKKYVGIAPRWDELVNDKEKHYEPVMERFFGTHQSIQESFLAKLIEMMKGVEERDKFIRLVKNKGFDYAEGFEVEIVTKEGETQPSIHINYKKDGEAMEDNFVFDEILPLEILEKIID